MVYPVIAENIPLESRLVEKGEGVPIIRYRKCRILKISTLRKKLMNNDIT
jgi:hypothetical protein